MSQLLRYIRRTGSVVETDRELLDRFTSDRDEEAFAAVVRRYGGGVLAACQRLAGRDAEDVYQAVFLILARRAGVVRGSLPAWLHQVARRVAANLRRSHSRRAAVEESAARPAVARSDDVTLREGLAALDEELARLPERYSAVLIVCCLEGRSRDEAAAQLGWSESQVKGRLQRAREMLRVRLSRRGIELGGVLLVGGLCGPARALVPVPLVVARSASPAVIALTNGVVRAMIVQKLKVVAAVLMLAAVVGVVVYRAKFGGAGDDAAKNAAPAVPPEPAVKGDTRDSIQGTWTVVEARMGDGLQAVYSDSKDQVWTITADRIAIAYPSFPGAATEMKYRRDAPQNPKWIDLDPWSPSQLQDGAPLVMKGFYELNGDELKICWDRHMPGKRPERFELVFAGALFVLKRAPEAKAK